MIVEQPAAAASGPGLFDHLPDRYDRLATLVSGELRAWMLYRLPGRGDRAVDLGCGTGVWTELLADRYTEVLAVDRSSPMLAVARRRRSRPNVDYQHRDLRTVTGRDDGWFDLVLCAYTLHHLPDPVAAVHHMRGLLRPGGQLVLVDLVDGGGDRPSAAGGPAADRVDSLSRRGLQAEAVRTFRDGLWRRRRPIREAVELLRLQLDRDWLNHQAAGRLLTVAGWYRLTGALLPGAATSRLHRTHALIWSPPGGQR